MAVVRKKQDDKYLEALRELITLGGGNRQCFDCGQKGPTYVNMTIGSFVCTRCSGVLSITASYSVLGTHKSIDINMPSDINDSPTNESGQQTANNSLTEGTHM
uniref:Arf-GAP domain-containing protein n=1 Tax=Glossina pallidipes TaxID=7398 RepID=A0A1B0AJR0_GLOPL